MRTIFHEIGGVEEQHVHSRLIPICIFWSNKFLIYVVTLIAHNLFDKMSEPTPSWPDPELIYSINIKPRNKINFKIHNHCFKSLLVFTNQFVVGLSSYIIVVQFAGFGDS